MDDDIELAAEGREDAAPVAALIERVFGPGRLARAAERLREGNEPCPRFCFVARDKDAIVGCVRLWPITVGGAAARLLGPLAVEPALRGRGVGAALVRRACAAAEAAGAGPILLVGDEPYYAPLGFAAAPAGLVMPGPVDPRRVLVRFAPGCDRVLSGLVRAGKTSS